MKKKKKEAVVNNKKTFHYLLFLIALFSIGCVVKAIQNDTFYTIKIGELIVKHGIDMLDHFSFHNIMYTYPHWLYDVFIYFVYKIGGFNGIFISTIVLNMVLLTIIFTSSKKINNTLALPFVMTFIAAFLMGKGYATARAQSVTYILFVLEVFFIEKYIKDKNKKYLFGLLVISLLICNIHVAVWPFYFIMFLPYIAEGIISIIAKKCNKDNKFVKYLNNKFDIKNDIPLKALFIILFLSIFTGLLTPIKLTPYTYLYKTMIGNSQKYIQEHQMINFKGSIFPLVIVVETIIIGLVSKIKLRDLFLLLGLGIMSVMSSRHAGLLAVLSPLVLVRTYIYFSSYLKLDIEGAFNRLIRKKVVIVLLFIIVATVSIFNLSKQIKKDYYVKDDYPIETTKFIKKNIDIKNMRIYNEYNFGSYLLFNDIPVFIDSRADLYTKQFSGLKYDIFDDYMNINDNYEKTFEFYKITHLLIYRDSALNEKIIIDKKYKQLFVEKNYALYERLK